MLRFLGAVKSIVPFWGLGFGCFWDDEEGVVLVERMGTLGRR